jgi:hypothetical protein
MLAHNSYDKCDQHGNYNCRIRVSRQALLQLSPQLQTVQSRFGGRPEEVGFSHEAAKKGSFIHLGQMSDLPCTGTLVSLTREKLNSGLDDTHFRDTSPRCFFHDLFSLTVCIGTTKWNLDGDFGDADIGSNAVRYEFLSGGYIGGADLSAVRSADL